MDILIEIMTKIFYHPYTVRCWRQENSYSPTVKTKTHEEIWIELASIDPNEYQAEFTIASRLLKISRMNAVEVIGNDSNGVVLYKDWP